MTQHNSAASGCYCSVPGKIPPFECLPEELIGFVGAYTIWVRFCPLCVNKGVFLKALAFGAVAGNSCFCLDSL